MSPFTPLPRDLLLSPTAADVGGQISQLLAESTDCSACLLAAPFLCMLDTCAASSHQVVPEPACVEVEEERGEEVVVERDDLEEAFEMRLGGDGGKVSCRESENWDLS